MPRDDDAIARTPDLLGPYGRAWRAAKADHAGLPHMTALWVVEARGAHPVWHSYMVSLIDLRPDDKDPPIIHLEGATHELAVAALDPKVARMDLLRGFSTRGVLHPLNFAAQFIAPHDEAAALQAEVAVLEICEGRLSPDSDFRAQWIERFGDSMMKDRQHG